VLHWLLEHYHAFTMALLAGFMIGSLRRIWPYQEYVRKTFGKKVMITEYTNTLPKSWGSEEILAVVLVFVGILVIFTMDMLVRQKDKATA
jgi:putative membrane protein